MPKIDIAKATVRTRASYPDPWRAIAEGREKAALGDVVGLTQFGVNVTRLKPGAASALRHWHEAEDEFVYVLEGEITLIEEGDTTVLQASPTVTTSSIGRNVMRFIWKSGRARRVSERIIRMSTSFTRGTRVACGFHAGRGSLIRSGEDRATSRGSRDASASRRVTQLPFLAGAV